MKLKKCNGCSIAQRRRNRVVGRGVIPADILFLGEAPGKAEDMLGEPFVGPSGKLLEQMIRDTATRMGLKGSPSYYITNSVWCRPFVQDEMDDAYLENREPTREEVLKCMPNVIKIARDVKPKIVVFIGKFAEKYYKKEFEISTRILHPAFLLRHGGMNSPYYLTTLRVLQEVFTQIEEVNHGQAA